MLSYKKIYHTHSKSIPLRKAQKNLKAKIKSENQQIQNQLILKEINQHKIRQQKVNKSIQKMRARCVSEDIYSSFGKNNFQISNFNKQNRAMTSKTHHYKNIISLRNRQKPPEIFITQNILNLGRSKISGKEVQTKLLGKRLITQRKEESEMNVKQITRKGFKALTLISDPKQRTKTLIRARSMEKQNLQSLNKEKQSEGVVSNFLRRQMSKKTIFSTNQQKTYRLMFPMIKEKKIHLR